MFWAIFFWDFCFVFEEVYELNDYHVLSFDEFLPFGCLARLFKLAELNFPLQMFSLAFASWLNFH